MDWFLAPSVIAWNKIGNLIIEEFISRQFGQAALDVPRLSSRIAREEIAVIALSIDQVALIGQHDQRVPNGGITMRVILHGVANEGINFGIAAVVLLMKRP